MKCWKEMLKSYSSVTGKSLSEVAELLFSYGDAGFRERYGIGSEDDKASKKYDGNDRKEAVGLVGREYAKYCQETSEKRYMESVIFGERSGRDLDKFLMDIEPETIWNRIFGRHHSRDSGWRQVE
jgi:hypothetical protein